MAKRYGVPYQGSKNGIAKWVLEHLPSNSTLVDLFAGGCAITHCAMESGKYDRFIANDLTDAPDVFWNAIHGEYRDETRWISREDFQALKDRDPYVALCWSFGNNRKTYLYSQKIEPYKKACHYAIVFDDWRDMERLCPDTVSAAQEALQGLTDTHERRLAFGPSIVKWLKANGTPQLVAENPLYSSCHVKRDTPSRKKGTYRDLESLQSLQRLQSLERLERLQSLQSLQSLERLQSLKRLTVTHVDYRDLNIPSGALVYADPPYRNTTAEGYANGGEFDYEAFDRWLAEVDHPVIVSEYTCPEGCVQIASKQKAVTMCSGGAKKAQEGLFIQERYLDWYNEQMTRQAGYQEPLLLAV